MVLLPTRTWKRRCCYSAWTEHGVEKRFQAVGIEEKQPLIRMRGKIGKGLDDNARHPRTLLLNETRGNVHRIVSAVQPNEPKK